MTIALVATAAVVLANPAAAETQAPDWFYGLGVQGALDGGSLCDLETDTLGCGPFILMFGPQAHIGRRWDNELELSGLAGYLFSGLHGLYKLGIEGRTRTSPTSPVWLGLTLGGLLSADQYTTGLGTETRLGPGFLVGFAIGVSVAKIQALTIQLEARGEYMHFSGEDKPWLKRAVRTGGRMVIGLGLVFRI